MKRIQNHPTRAELVRWLRTHKIGGGADTAGLTKAVDDITSSTAAVEGAKDSVIAFVTGSAAATAKAVSDALLADNADDQARVDISVAAINSLRDRQLAAAQQIADAIVASPTA